MKIRSITAILCLASTLSLPPAVRAQDQAPAKPDAPREAPAEAKDEAAPTSKAAGIALPQGAPEARRVTDKVAVTALSAQLKKLGQRAGLPLGTPEVLTWSGQAYKREAAKDVVASVTGALTEAGFEYRAMGGPMPAVGSTTSLFTASNDKQQKMLMGYWVEADSMLVLVWATLENPEADAFPAAPSAPAKPAEPAK